MDAVTFAVEREGSIVRLLVEVNGHHERERLGGPAEYCRPETVEFEVVRIIDEDGNAWDGTLTSQEHEKLIRAWMRTAGRASDLT